MYLNRPRSSWVMWSLLPKTSSISACSFFLASGCADRSRKTKLSVPAVVSWPANLAGTRRGAGGQGWRWGGGGTHMSTFA